MNLLSALSQIGKDIKALVLKDNDLEQKIQSLESKGIDQGTLDTLKTTIKAEAKAETKAEIKAEIKAELIDGAPEALDTLKEIADQLANDKSASTALATAVANRVRFDEAQSLSNEQKQQVAQNLGLDDPTVDYLAEYERAKA